MKKGISPIVAVVLLIAIAVIAAVGLYFWVGGLATKQPTPSTPVVMNAQTVTCGTGMNNITVMIQDLSASTNIDNANLTIVVDNGTCYTNGTSITAGQQKAVTFGCNANGLAANYSHTVGSTYVISVAPNNATGISQAPMVC